MDRAASSEPPAEITHLVRQRSEARVRRDWATADSLKAQIEAAGWKVVDRGQRTSVSRAAASAVVVEGEIRYGSAAAVPSRLEGPADAPWTIVLLASEEPERLSRLLGALRAHAPAGTRVVVVANDPSDSQAAALSPDGPERTPIGGREIEILRTATRLGYASALDVALRRSSGELVLLAAGSAWPRGDALTPLARALDDPEIAVAGAFGLVSEEPQLRPAALSLSNARHPLAILGAWMAFRRSDLIALGPLDERFVSSAWLDVWWSLRLRVGVQTVEPAESAGSFDSAPEEAAAEGSISDGPNSVALEAEQPPRRAVRLDLPLESDAVAWPPDRSRLARRNMYRVLDQFAWRTDLVQADPG